MVVADTAICMALGNITVADFTQLMQGPWATQKLAETGAEVIKIEPPGGELMRGIEVGGRLHEGISPWFLAVNRNKRSISLDLKSEGGSEVAQRIIEQSDVLVENFRPGVMERLGFGYDDVQEMNPDIVYVSASGYGSSGPYVDRPAQDLLLQGLSGMTSYTGQANDPPTPAGTAVIDEHSAMLIAFHTVVALYHRQRTGEGQSIEVNLYDSAVDLQCQEITAALTMETSFERSEEGIAHAFVGAPYGVYETADGHITISNVPLDGIADAFGMETLLEYDSPEVVFEKRDEIKAKIERYTRQHSSDDLMERLLERDIWAGYIQTYDDLADDPQLTHNDMIVTLDHPKIGEFITTGIPVEMSETQPQIRSPPPLAGEHSKEVLRDLGYDPKAIERLTDRNAVYVPTR